MSHPVNRRVKVLLFSPWGWMAQAVDVSCAVAVAFSSAAEQKWNAALHRLVGSC